ncbi:MAG: hypothetical protein E7337_15375 [Clostridiales bacterium]|nr:hypothetical protein [Clostridiales bacterium]
MNNSEFLQLYQNRNEELCALQRLLVRCGGEGKPHGVSSIDYSRVMRSTNERSAADCQNYDGLQAEIDSLQTQLAAMEPRFQSLMQDARNYKERLILRLYYRQRQTDEKIAEALDISVRHANRMRHALLKYLDR